MAILKGNTGVQVYVRVGGRIAKEYRDPDPPPPTQNRCPVMCKYIDSLTNLPFVIDTYVDPNYDFSYKNHTLSFHVYVDGKYMVNNCTGKEYVLAGCGYRSVSGPVMMDEQGANVVQQKFRFSPVKTGWTTIGEIAYRGTRRKARDIGVIEVQVFRIILREVTGSQRGSALRGQDLELSEKALKGKAISHGASCGKVEAPRQQTKNHEWDDIPEDRGPIAVYRFLYRSRGE
ncbi:uncharacterized protein PG986_002371 [Apiospora aurea]|uniref:DUF7918 domain-containing protein n=1 Tax=Apiospora aurea TaxID=335848 RepID=A0ABR1QZP3_9PEZI